MRWAASAVRRISCVGGRGAALLPGVLARWIARRFGRAHPLRRPDGKKRGKRKVERELLRHGTPVYISDTHRFGSDALLLSGFCRPRRDERAADLGSGCGIIALRWHDLGHRGRCEAIELQAEGSALLAAACAEAGIEHILPVTADLRTFGLDRPECFDLVGCNPPYFAAGRRSPDPARAAARHEDYCTLRDAAGCAARLLRYGGRFALCGRPERLAEAFCALREAGLEPKRLALVKQTPESAPRLFLCEAKKGAKPGLVIEPDLLGAGGAGRYDFE